MEITISPYSLLHRRVEQVNIGIEDVHVYVGITLLLVETRRRIERWCAHGGGVRSIVGKTGLGPLLGEELSVTGTYITSTVPDRSTCSMG